MNREDQLDAILFDLKLAAEMVHNDSELASSPEAGPSNDELHENSHEENGASPVLDGDLHSPERANVNAMREALETQVEMEVGKPISEKELEVKQEPIPPAAAANQPTIIVQAPPVVVIQAPAQVAPQAPIQIPAPVALTPVPAPAQVAPMSTVDLSVNGKPRSFEFATAAARDTFVKEALAKFGSKVHLIK